MHVDQRHDLTNMQTNFYISNTQTCRHNNYLRK